MGEIRGLWRWAAGAVSIALLGLGVAATFDTDNELGTSALVIAGALGGLVTALGAVPPFKMGGVEFGILQAERADAAEDVADHVEEAAAKPGATVESVAQAAKEAADELAERAQLLYEFGRSANLVTRVANEPDQSGRIWTVWRRNGVPYKARFQAENIVEFGKGPREREDESDPDSE